MTDLLGATNPVPGYDNTTINRNVTISPENSPVQNVVDPSRVMDPDGRTERQDAGQTSGGPIRYDSNFNTFIQRLRASPDLVQLLGKLFSGGEALVVESGISEGIAGEMGQILEMMKMDQSQLKEFLSGQLKAGSRFGGPLFALLRGTYGQTGSVNVRNDILSFLKCYTDHSSTGHIERNILRNLRGMAESMPASWGEQVGKLADVLEEKMAAGDRKSCLNLLQRQLFPYMGSYVSKSHDMGRPRALLTLLALDVARYENGSEENLLQEFHRLTSYGTLKEQLGGVDDKALLALLRTNEFDPETPANQFSERLAKAAVRALRGEGSADQQEVFRQLVGAVLVNESVYMPVNHYILPIQWEDRMLFSEMWVDPDAEEKQKSGESERVMKFLFKVDVQSLGMFDVVLTSRQNEVELLVACPQKVSRFSGKIEETLRGILKRNGLNPAGIRVKQMERPLTLTEVFPKIFEGKNSINVKV